LLPDSVKAAFLCAGSQVVAIRRAPPAPLFLNQKE
jgi:hypothetical protein